MSDIRSSVVTKIILLLRRKRPRAFILENVPALLTRHRAAFESLVESIDATKSYHLYWKVLNAEDFGVPQHRPRLFIVGLDRSWSSKGAFRFPRGTGRVSLDAFLLPRQGRASRRSVPSTVTSMQNLGRALADLRSRGFDPLSEPWTVNVDASPGRAHVMFDRCPCLTRSRQHGHWVTNRGRFTLVSEMLQLQGLPVGIRRRGITDRQLASLIGNSICVDVLVALLRRILPAVGLG